VAWPCGATPRIAAEFDVSGVHRRSNPAGVHLGRDQGRACSGRCARAARRPRARFGLPGWRRPGCHDQDRLKLGALRSDVCGDAVGCAKLVRRRRSMCRRSDGAAACRGRGARHRAEVGPRGGVVAGDRRGGDISATYDAYVPLPAIITTRSTGACPHVRPAHDLGRRRLCAGRSVESLVRDVDAGPHRRRGAHTGVPALVSPRQRLCGTALSVRGGRAARPRTPSGVFTEGRSCATTPQRLRSALRP
jgi:hypothetical protein